MKLTYRDDEKIIITNSNNYKEEYDILAIFPFSSESKRMGIVLNNKDTNQKIFYLKGAENVIEKLEAIIGKDDSELAGCRIKLKLKQHQGV